MDLEGLFENVYQQTITNTEQFKVQGIKMLILDSHTLRIVSQMTTQTRLAADEIAVTQTIQKCVNIPPTPHASALFFVQPTSENVSLLCSILAHKTKKFSAIYLTFSDQLSDYHMDQLAQSDKHALVQSLKIVFFNYQPIMNNMCLLDDQNPVQSLTSLLLSYGVAPFSIRYQTGSSDTQTFAEQLAKELSAHQDLFNRYHRTKAQQRPVEVIVMDRKLYGPENLLTGCSMMQMLEELKQVTKNNGTVVVKGQTIPISYFTHSPQGRAVLSGACFQAMEQISQLNRQQQQITADVTNLSIEQQSRLLQQHDALKQQQNELTNLGLFVRENRDAIIHYNAVGGLQRQILGGMTKLEGPTFQAFRTALDKRRGAAAETRRHIAEFFACGVVSFAWMLPEGVRDKQMAQNLQQVRDFLAFLDEFAAGEAAELIGRCRAALVACAAASRFDWAAVQQASQAAIQQFNDNLLKNQFRTAAAGLPLTEQSVEPYRYKLLQVLEAALMFRLPDGLFPVLPQYKSQQAQAQSSGETPVVLVCYTGSGGFQEACGCLAYSGDGDIARAVQQCCMIACTGLACFERDVKGLL